MPKKIRELKSMLRKAGFSEQPAKGSHTKWLHPLYPGRITLSGKDGQDAKPYQEKEIAKALTMVNEQGDQA
ncbi:type II toxin-antitoxin system HicA family toxin [Acaryochloris sp. CCMEE 5410]|uniref:type II toxin-antitoxin system HicA family toxin n=1 Tax=Acaryochloris sp. CCMEE 5410 TaxID=310037 RepID=UPI000493FD15|nr:type II toxin-antitoxin system HicA family toxin [Acaryochloris sp. CCMEE 5410]KAI9130435.1 type II toxin-antitoxin system HicA family toxin [Acaryochloris sp. CCMEE 5410]